MLRYISPFMICLFLGLSPHTPVYCMQKDNASPQADDILKQYFTPNIVARMQIPSKNRFASFVKAVLTDADLQNNHTSWVQTANMTIKMYTDIYTKLMGVTPNIHEFVRYFDMIRPQFSLIFWQTLKPEQPNNFFTSLIERINTFPQAGALKTEEYLTNLMKDSCPDNKRMIQLLWEAWYLAEFIDKHNGNSAKRESFVETLPNIGMEQMCGTGKPNNVFYLLHRHLLQEALELME